MAQVFPKRSRPDTPASERRVLAALSRLHHPWRVFHSVAWQSIRDGRPGDGEADFVLLHPEQGLLVLDVKGGGIEIHDGRWVSTDRNGERHETKDPLEQARASKHALVAYLNDVLKSARKSLPHLRAGHGAILPDMPEGRRLGPAGPEEIVWGRRELANPRQSVERLVAHWKLSARLTAGDVEAISALLAPTIHVRPLLRDQVADADTGLLELTQEQMRVLDQMRRNRRLITYGGAGTGKTLLAVERTRRLADDGFRVLLTSFNQPLGEYLAREFDGNEHVVAGHFHEICRKIASQTGLLPKPEPFSAVAAAGAASEGAREWFDERLPELLQEGASRIGLTVDAVVVDEGQDFAPAWWTVLQLLLEDPDSGPFYVFADDRQNIYRPGWSPPFEQPAYDLQINCRNTLPIARRVAAVVGTPTPLEGVDGPEPEFLLAESTTDIEHQVRGAFQRLLHDERLRPDQIVVLANRKQVVQDLRGKSMAGQPLVEPGQTGVAVETIHRFKGLESDVAIVVLSAFKGETDRALAYIGMSRAKGYLVVIGTSEVREKIGWDSKSKPQNGARTPATSGGSRETVQIDS